MHCLQFKEKRQEEINNNAFPKIMFIRNLKQEVRIQEAVLHPFQNSPTYFKK